MSCYNINKVNCADAMWKKLARLSKLTTRYSKDCANCYDNQKGQQATCHGSQGATSNISCIAWLFLPVQTTPRDRSVRVFAPVPSQRCTTSNCIISYYKPVYKRCSALMFKRGIKVIRWLASTWWRETHVKVSSTKLSMPPGGYSRVYNI